MSLELKQHLRLSQQLVMTPQLQQAIKLLQLSRMELESLIDQELEENPLLEDGASTIEQDQQESAEELTSVERFVEEVDQLPANPSEESVPEVTSDATNEIDWENYLDSYLLAPSTPTGGSREIPDDLPSYEATLTRGPTLFEHLVGQVGLGDFSDEEKRVALLILGNLDDDGYFRIEGYEGDPLIAVASEAGVGLRVAGRTLERLQKLEPLGVCARDLEECLLLQARAWGEENGLVGEIIRKHLKNLEAKNLKAICDDLGADREDVIAAIQVIEEMDPKPARHFASEDPRYITPDVYVHKIDDEYVVVVNDDGLSKLRISKHYRDALRSGAAKANGSRDYIQEKLRSAVWLIRSIHQRQRTIYKVTESIMKFQRDFLDKGISHLRPLILREIAEDIGMHESTVSRVTTNKYVHTPRGIFELKYFFNAGISRTSGDDVASEAVKHEIVKLIESEDPKKPYSDQRIAELLKGKGIEIARRTVAKYREMLGILPSSKRKSLY